MREQRRADKIRDGLDPDPPEPTADEIAAETIAMRARNDQALGEMQGRLRTYD